MGSTPRPPALEVLRHACVNRSGPHPREMQRYVVQGTRPKTASWWSTAVCSVRVVCSTKACPVRSSRPINAQRSAYGTRQSRFW